MSEISKQIAEFFNKHLPEDIKVKGKHLFASFKTEKDEETKKEFAEVKLKAEAFIKDNKDTAKVAEVKLALESKDLSQLKVLLAEDAPATESYNEAPLADGTILKYTGDLAVGAKCLLVTPEGEIPAPEGEHKLADGSVIVIKKEGEDSVIAELKPAEEMKTATTPAQMEAMISKIVDAKFTSQEKTIKELRVKLEAAELKLSKKSSQLADLGIVVEAMASIGTEAPINITEKQKPSNRISPPIEKTPL